ncbi:hypothetical protein [Deinococcus sp.]|uniref:hypothetical protein n=1 Tax=Deinococcus sp. TaxID=47478 RepID=UPI003CC6DD24
MKNADVLRHLLTAPAVLARVAQTKVAQGYLQRSSQAWSAAATGSANYAAGGVTPETSASLGFTINRASTLDLLATRVSTTQTLQSAQVSYVRAALSEARRRLNIWHSMRLSSAELGATQAELEAAEMNLGSVKGRLEDGAATPLQLDSAQTDLNNAAWNLQQAATAFTQSQADWLAFFGGSELDDWTPLPLPDHLTDDESAVNLAAALLNTEQNLAQEGARDAPAVQLNGQLSGDRFGLGGSVSTTGSVNLSGNVSLASGAPRAASVSLGLSGQLPLLSGASLTPALLNTQVALSAALQDARAQQSRSTLTSAGVARNTVERVAVLRATLEAARRALAVSLLRHQNGLTSALDQKNAVAIELRAEKQLLTGQRDADLAVLDAWDAALWLPGALIP